MTVIRQPFTRGARRAKYELARRTIGRFPVPAGSRAHRCPICRYHGPFLSRGAVTGKRKRAQCPSCGSLERHRMQRLVMTALAADVGFDGERVLEFAPERFSARYLEQRFTTRVTADLARGDVSTRLDITRLPFVDQAFDVVIASHVLEHVRDDRAALREVARVMTSDGLAILPVPIVNQTTTEYPCANVYEDFHVRAPGLDYYKRYLDAFETVVEYRSSDFDELHQVYLREDRSGFPSERFPNRQAWSGDRHEDIVAVAMGPKLSCRHHRVPSDAPPASETDGGRA